MTALTHLPTLLASMAPVLTPETYVFCSVAKLPPRLKPIMTFHEGPRLTLIIPLAQAEAANLPYQFECRMITLQVHSALEAVGFLAAVTTRLAQAGIGVNPVSAYYHDHLFVPAPRAQEALRLLQALSEEHRATRND